MKKTLFLLSVCTLSAFADPFYSSTEPLQAVEKQENFAKNLPKEASCRQLQHSKMGNLPELGSLTLVGILSIDGEFHSLFVDEEEQLVPLKKGDGLSDGSQVEQIDFKGVKFLGFSDDCLTPRYFAYKL